MNDSKIQSPLFSGHARQNPVRAGQGREGRGEPWHWRHNPACYRAARDEAAQPVFDEDSVRRLRGVWVKGGEGDGSNHAIADVAGEPVGQSRNIPPAGT